ncbi:MAG TPA: bifunctional (p)ppGpp synthetase/guanosine-3',5'-bis(diphosphate) 3'-pyrophosphohydrolase [Polyangiaceae bacterium]|nr:MAG: Bifunctional (p)ppGpp synthase/hydrolase RelA [Deltaproteobacteria bacterium ADurb.Bin207]HQM08326.1 bifunctional (p)ppGpp synthetase/guanosine-3',5'-bis(diphosphate) 3'-pyrophosphohydrolase [Polyangiaceae bacterium]
MNLPSSRTGTLPLEVLIERVLAYQPTADTELLRKAYDFANSAHEGQVRKSGDPYFAHPAAVAGVITELRLDAACVCAGLLHDVVEDTAQSVDDLEKVFGKEVAFLVDGVTKLSKLEFSSRQERDAENLRKMLVAMSRDIRVLLLKLCDRVDNMRTLEFMKPDSQERIARETREVFAPLAARLGIHRFKTELEDLSFQFLETEAHQNLSRLMGETKAVRERFSREICEELRKQLHDHGFAGEVYRRTKHLYSIHRQMVEYNLDFEQLRDLVAFHVIMESVADCYGVMGAIHSRYTPIPGRIKDYIALPKPNMYQSLHTTVIGTRRERVEIQIRTKEMDRVAQEGIAAHWIYEDRLSGGADPKLMQRLGWLHDLLDVQREVKDAAEFLDSIRIDLFQDEVYAFTPKGEARVFPKGATAIDFAYAIHTEIGHHSSSARVNGTVSSLRHKLRNGDMIEMITSPDQRPKKEWLEFAATSRARNRIRAYLRNEERERSSKLGKELLEKELHDNGFSLQRFTKDDAELGRVLGELEIPTLQDLFIAVGYGKVAPASVTQTLSRSVDDGAKLKPKASVREGRIEHFVRRLMGKDVQGLKVSEIDDVLVRFARCCNPLPGDEIIGFITRGRGITVHRRDCTKAFETDPDRRIAVVWDSRVKANRSVQLKVLTVNRPGLLASMGQAFSDQDINLTAVTSRAVEDGRAMNIFTFPCADLSQLKIIMRALRKVQGVFSVERV